MGGCASKNKQPKEEAYKPANAPTAQPDFEEIVAEEKVSTVASKPPMKINGSVAEGEKRQNEYRNSLVGPGGVILPNQPQVKDETDPSIPYIDASEDELDDEPAQSRPVKAVQPIVEAAVEPVKVVGVEAVAPEPPQPVEEVVVNTDDVSGAVDDVSATAEAEQLTVPAQEVGDTEGVSAIADTQESEDFAQSSFPEVNDTGESFVDEVLRGVAPQLMACDEFKSEPVVDVEAVAGAVEEEAGEAATSVVNAGKEAMEDDVEEVVQNGLTVAEEQVTAVENVAADAKEAAVDPVVEDAQNINLDAAAGGIIQMGENSFVEVQSGFESEEPEQLTEMKETPEGLNVTARGPGGPGIVQIGSNNKVLFGTSNGQTEEAQEFTQFRQAGNEDTDRMASQDQIAKISESVGFIFSPYVVGTGFRVGDRYIMTAYHLIRDMFDKMAAQGIPTPEQHILGNKEIWIQFDYILMGEYEFDNLTRFKFASFRYSNPQLDVVIIELEPQAEKTLPPPLEDFCGMGKRHQIEFVSHDGAPKKRWQPSNLLLQPAEEEIEKASEWCKKRGFPPRGYDGLRETKRIRFQCAFQYATSGSPGVVVNDQDVFVVVLLTKGYPSFYLDVDEDQQKAIPNGLKVVEGASMTDVYLDMKDQANLAELCDNIFGLTVSKQES